MRLVPELSLGLALSSTCGNAGWRRRRETLSRVPHCRRDRERPQKNSRKGTQVDKSSIAELVVEQQPGAFAGISWRVAFKTAIKSSHPAPHRAAGGIR